MKYDYDLVVIGGGSGGYGAARKAVAQGLKVAVVDSSEELGGTCILKGCMPSKILIETANTMRTMREAGRFCVRSESPILDHDGLHNRLNTLRDGFSKGRKEALKNSDFKLFRGTGRFLDEHSVEVIMDKGKEVLSSKCFVISTGSKPFIPDIPGLKESAYWTSEEVTDLTRIPESVAVLGAGAIGMEFTHLYEGFGSKVTVFARSRVLSNVDEDLSEALKKESEQRGITVFEETEVEKVEEKGGVFTLTFPDGSQSKKLEVDALIVATGRGANIDQLSLESAGLKFSKMGIEINKHCQTNKKHIFAVGDCASTPSILHIAVMQGEAVGRELQKEEKTDLSRFSEEEFMLGVFTEPEVTKVGYSLEEAKKKEFNAVELSLEFSNQGKGEIKQSDFGFAKVVFDKKSDKILGASAIGPNVVDHIHLILMAINQGLTAQQFLNIPYYHPTLAEVWSYIVEDYLSS